MLRVRISVMNITNPEKVKILTLESQKARFLGSEGTREELTTEDREEHGGSQNPHSAFANSAETKMGTPF
jgi:hypothetical protein